MEHLLLLRNCNLSQCREKNTNETNSFNTIKCTTLRSYIHSKAPNYVAYSSVFVKPLLYVNSYSTPNSLVTLMLCVYVTILHNMPFAYTYPLYVYSHFAC